MNTFKVFLILLGLLTTLVCCLPTDNDFEQEIRQRQEEIERQRAEMSQNFAQMNNEMTEQSFQVQQSNNDSSNNYDDQFQKESNRMKQDFEEEKEKTEKGFFDFVKNIWIFAGIAIGGIILLGAVIFIFFYKKIYKRAEKRMDQALEDRREFMKNGGVIQEHYHYGYRYY